MRPVPLTDPSNNIVTYACPLCKKQATHNEEKPELGPGYAQADRCCRCYGCNNKTRIEPNYVLYCKKCLPFENWSRMWGEIGRAAFYAIMKTRKHETSDLTYMVDILVGLRTEEE